MTDNTQDATDNVQPEQVEQTEKIDAPAVTEPGHADQPADNSNREAAKYRRQLRDTEAELVKAQEALTGLRNAVIQRHLNDAERSLFKLTNQDPSAFFHDDGEVNEAHLEAIRQQWRTEHAALFGTNRVANTWDRPEKPTQSDGWTSAFGPQNT